ncbi:MAG: hypothetical protein CM1200mP3_11750 [Chloroflexota bacterium]|nr:MAG: hypothetical protein CM1200mP3_11750 [Chloroflexota bacterium]
MATLQISSDTALLGHLIRRAAFGASASKLENLRSVPYEEIVEDLIHVEKYPRIEEDLLSVSYPAC